MAADGYSNQRIAQVLGTDPHTVGRWRARFRQGGPAELLVERPRGGRPKEVSPEQESLIVRLAQSKNPTNGRPWSTRSLAEHLGVSHMRIARVWRQAGVAPGLGVGR
jgi:transposase